MDTQTFLSSVEDFLRDSKMSDTRFGKEALRDPMFVFELRNGRNVSLKLVERVNRFMSEHREPAEG